MTQLQEALTLALKHLDVPLSLGLAIMLSLKTEEEQAELAVFLRDNLERRPSAAEIDAKVSEILNTER